MTDLESTIEFVYEEMHTPEMVDSVEAWASRDGIQSMAILTITEPQVAAEVAEWLASVIRGKVVAEIGAGVGLLAIEMARYAKHVYAIEADPAWSWAFTKHLFDSKPANLTWIFGSAQSVEPWLRTDVAVVVTRSDHAGMQKVAGKIALSVIDVIEEGKL